MKIFKLLAKTSNSSHFSSTYIIPNLQKKSIPVLFFNRSLRVTILSEFLSFFDKKINPQGVGVDPFF
jgi:hypothetical protein